MCNGLAAPFSESGTFPIVCAGKWFNNRQISAILTRVRACPYGRLLRSRQRSESVWRLKKPGNDARRRGGHSRNPCCSTGRRAISAVGKDLRPACRLPSLSPSRKGCLPKATHGIGLYTDGSKERRRPSAAP